MAQAKYVEKRAKTDDERKSGRPNNIYQILPPNKVYQPCYISTSRKSPRPTSAPRTPLLVLSPVLQEAFRSSREAQYPKDWVPCNPSGDQRSQSDEISVGLPAHTLSLFSRMCFTETACHLCAVPHDWAHDLLITRLRCRTLSPSTIEAGNTWKLCRARSLRPISQHEVDPKGPFTMVF